MTKSIPCDEPHNFEYVCDWSGDPDTGDIEEWEYWVCRKCGLETVEEPPNL